MLWKIKMFKYIFYTILLTIAPFSELRGGMTYGLLMGLQPQWVFVLCFFANIIIVPIVYLFYHKLIHYFLFVPFVKRLYDRVVIKTQKKVQKYVDKWGVIGLTLFIAIPLPGSGIYSGILGGYLLGMRKRDIFPAAFFGTLLAAVAVYIIVTSSMSVF